MRSVLILHTLHNKYSRSYSDNWKSKNMNVIRAHFRRMQNVLLALASIADGSEHNVTKGTLREIFLKEFLKPILPHDIGVVSGEIIDSYGNRSGQVDCILIDKTLPQLYLGSPDHLIVLAESVLATIEIKSNLTGDELSDSLISSYKIKCLKKRGVQCYTKGSVSITISPAWPIATFVFAYRGATLRTLLDRVTLFCENYSSPKPIEASEVPESICVLDKGLLQRDSDRLIIRDGNAHLPGQVQVRTISLEKDSLYRFLIALMEEIIPIRTKEVDLDNYFSIQELE